MITVIAYSIVYADNFSAYEDLLHIVAWKKRTAVKEKKENHPHTIAKKEKNAIVLYHRPELATRSHPSSISLNQGWVVPVSPFVERRRAP